MSYSYFEVSAFTNSDYDELEILFGSYNKGEAIYELQAEKASWKGLGYRRLCITARQVEDAPDREVYPELFNSGGQYVNH